MPHTFTKFSFFFLFLLTGYFAKAQDSYTWTGAVGTDWNNAGNWSPAGVPGILDNARLDNSNHSISKWPALTADLHINILEIVFAEIDVQGYLVNARSVFVTASSINNSGSKDIKIICESFGMGRLSTMNGDAVITCANSFGDNGSHYKGKAKIIVNGNGNLLIRDVNYPGYTETASKFDGDLEIERTVSGLTEISSLTTNLIPQTKINVGGNFKYTNLAGGYTYIYSPQVQGKIDINVSGSTPASGRYEDLNYCYLHFLSNNVAGGTIDVKNYQGFELHQSSIKVDHVSATGIKNPEDFATVRLTQSTVVGDVSVQFDQVEDILSSLSVNANTIIGNSNFAFNRKGGISLSKGSYSSSNHFFGNVSVTVEGTEQLYFYDSDGSEYEQNLILNGDIRLYQGSSPNIEAAKFKFVGTSDSELQWSNSINSIMGSITLEKSGLGKLVLADPIQLIGNLKLVNGILQNDALNSLTFLDNITATGASDLSHITGPVHKIGDDAFTFPTGSGTKLMPVSISAPSSPTDEFSVQYLSSSPTSAGYNTGSKAATLSSVYNGSFWDVKRVAGSGNVAVSLGYNLSSGNVTDQSKLRVAHWNGSMWEDLGNGGTSGSLTVGTVSTAGGVTSFSPFTIASADASNPLPVKLAKFSVRKENTTALLQWTTTEEINSDRFEIEHSLNAKNWQKIGEVKAAGESKSSAQYDYVHTNPLKGLNYYRLKMLDADETFAYSKIEKIQLNDGTQTAMYPNPVSDKLFVETANGISAVKAELMSIIGTNVLSASAADLRSGLDLSKLSAGIYFVNITLSNGQKETHKVFVNK